MSNLKLYGERLRLLIYQFLEKNPREVAREIGGGRAEPLYNAINGITFLSVENMYKLYEAYGVNLHWLVTGEGAWKQDDRIKILESKLEKLQDENSILRGYVKSLEKNIEGKNGGGVENSA